VRYSIEPWPGCSGCQVSGWSNVQNQEHFVCHETREAVTDADLNAWWDSTTGNEADDKCAWTPTPFLGTGGYAYQWEWSKRLRSVPQDAALAPRTLAVQEPRLRPGPCCSPRLKPGIV
jgi:hypothetical protein